MLGNLKNVRPEPQPKIVSDLKVTTKSQIEIRPAETDAAIDLQPKVLPSCPNCSNTFVVCCPVEPLTSELLAIT